MENNKFKNNNNNLISEGYVYSIGECDGSISPRLFQHLLLSVFFLKYILLIFYREEGREIES